MPHTEGIDNVVVYWDDEDGEYNAGQLLTGRIEVNEFEETSNDKLLPQVHVLKTTSFRGIRLKVSEFVCFCL